MVSASITAAFDDPIAVHHRRDAPPVTAVDHA